MNFDEINIRLSRVEKPIWDFDSMGIYFSTTWFLTAQYPLLP